ncbi:MAG: MFS transporter, partial [Mycobacteriales bacterium]
LMTASIMPLFFFLTLYMQRVLHFSPIESGLGQVPAALSFALLGTPIAKLVSRVGYRVPATVGGLLTGVGIFWLSRFDATGTYLSDILVPLTVAALGASLSFISLMIAATSEAPLSEAGLASGLVNTTQQIGGAVGLAVLSTIAASGTTRAAEHGDAPLPALTTGFSSGLTVAAGTAIAVGVLAAVLLRKSRRPTTDPAAARAEHHMVGEDPVAKPIPSIH